MIGNCVYKLVRHVFMGRHLDQCLNQTLLVLIPKSSGVESTDPYRPVRLCTILYKIVTETSYASLDLVDPVKFHTLSVHFRQYYYCPRGDIYDEDDEKPKAMDDTKSGPRKSIMICFAGTSYKIHRLMLDCQLRLLGLSCIVFHRL